MGVKSLWSLLTPVGRPVMLENMEGKAMAIDSSIWIYQFQATMRDKDGRALVNAHLLGFLRRVAKLLYYGIKPVFVFDGGAPVLKRLTINDRRKKKAGAAASHAKITEKLLAAQMRREALNHAESSRSPTKASAAGDKDKGKGKAAAPFDEDGAVYLEDIDPNSHPTEPRRVEAPAEPTSSLTDASPAKKDQFYDHDGYRLPPIDYDAVIQEATTSDLPDPRLATQDELQAFIQEMRPEDLDVASEAFRDLPTEVQYEIVGDLWHKSRQTSYDRLQKMLDNAATPLDFSKQQIKHLQKRNQLTQQMWATTDNTRSLPVRIANERNREYVLMKNVGDDGGWILGIRDDGTREKPIEIDQDEEKNRQVEVEQVDSGEESVAEMEEVAIPEELYDADLREYQREQNLVGVSNRSTTAARANVATRKEDPLFIPDPYDEADNENAAMQLLAQDLAEEDENAQMAQAIQESLNVHSQQSQSNPNMNAYASSSKAGARFPAIPNAYTTTSASASSSFSVPTPSFRLGPVLSIANTSPKKAFAKPKPADSMFGDENGLLRAVVGAREPMVLDSDDDDMEEIHIEEKTDTSTPVPEPKIIIQFLSDSEDGVSDGHGEPTAPVEYPLEPKASVQSLSAHDDSDNDMEEVIVTKSVPKDERALATVEASSTDATSDMNFISNNLHIQDDNPLDHPHTPVDDGELSFAPNGLLRHDTVGQVLKQHSSPVTAETTFPQSSPSSAHHRAGSPILVDAQKEFAPTGLLEVPISNDDDEQASLPLPTPILQNQLELSSTAISQKPISKDGWSRSPSPIPEDHFGDIERAPSPTAEDWDAAQEMDVTAEEGEFARFMSQVKGNDLADVRREIDEEITALNQQKKVAMRDSDEISQAMISQIMMMLRLFGIPYITAPMEAEAQCAELASLGLVDGVITDDSDVFLFGAQRVFKNMFNQSKTVECFVGTDLSRELGLERDTLIRLAYLLGSDYVDGLPGVGPVVAMEMLKEFPGEDGLHKFKEWWLKVQSGKDREEDNKSKFRKSFKKKFKSLYLSTEWPNPAVRDAYYHPAVDNSEEPFKWGLPDLDALRHFLREELGWAQGKVDELLLPVIQKMGKRGQANALNRQDNLNQYFDITLGSGNYAPRKRQAYASKRLQQVVSDFRKGQRASPDDDDDDNEDRVAEEDEGPPKKKARVTKPKGKNKAETTAQTAVRGAAKRGRGRARGAAAASTGRKRKKVKPASDQEDESDDDDATFEGKESRVQSPPPLEKQLRPRPKPRPLKRSVATDTPPEDN